MDELIKNEDKGTSGRSLCEYYEKASPIPFYTMLGLFVFSNMLLVIQFRQPIAGMIEPTRFVINSILLICCVMYIAFEILLWKVSAVTAIISAALITIVGLGWNFIGQTNEFFCTTVAMFLALLAYKRDFKVILKIVLVCHILTMMVAAIGLPLHYTELVYKVDTIDNGFSMGLIYPNHVSRMLFLILMIVWYLWGQEKKILTIVIGFAAACFSWRIVNCRTIAVFFIAFPICWVVYSAICPSGKKDTGDRKLSVFAKMWYGIMVSLPFLCMLFTYIMGKCRGFFMDRWHFGESIYSLWMRFISSGILLDTYRFPLVGTNINEETAPLEIRGGQVYMANIIDNAYVYYLISIGGIALILCMLWISFANYRAIKNRDSAFLLMSIFMCGYGIIEIVFFQFEHNFLFFYPLTATAMAYIEKHKKSTPAENSIPVTEDIVGNCSAEQDK